ncbi:MAG: hypothetical protein IKW03_06705 [Clostridia bacterium]|nr:hypothetical protein [Clostridia bacterium]
MKKSHEYDSPVLSRLVSVVTVFAICICSICCIVTAAKVAQLSTGSAPVANQQQSNPGTQQSNPGTQQSNPGTQDTTPGAQTQTPENPGTQTPENPGTQTPENPGTEQPSSGPSKEDILKKYTEVMDKLKGGVATYEKKEFQTLADDYDLGTVGNLVLPIAQNLMTSEDEAELQKRDDAAQIPIIRNTKGCLLTDVSKIKSATMTESGGKTTIVIVLNDEKNPLPAEEGATSCDSAVGSMMNPLSKKEIDNIVAEFSGVVTMNKFELTGKDCTATLVFDTATGKVESLTQIMNYFIEVDAKAVIVPVSGYATLTNKMTINNVTYK